MSVDMTTTKTIEETRPGDVVIKLEDSWSFLRMLRLLSEGEALKDWWSPDFVYPDKIVQTGLSVYLYIFDALLFHERVILPLVKPLEKYRNFADELLASDVVLELLKMGFIQTPPELFDLQSYYHLRNKLVETALLDRRIFLIAKLNKYCLSLQDSSKDILNFKPMYEFRDTTTPWKIPDIMGKAVPLTYDAEACALSLLTDIPVFKTTSNLPTISCLNDSILYAWNYVKERLDSVRKELTEDLIKDRLVQNQEIFNVPFTLSLVLREIPDSSSPTELFDVALRMRRDKSVRKFREWLARFHRIQTEGHLGQIAKTRAEVLAVAESLRQEFGLQNIEQKVQVGFSDVAKDVFDDILNVLTFKPPKSVVKRFFDSLEIWLRKRNIQHLFFLQQLGRTGINVRNIESELERCFGKSEDVIYLSEHIKNYSLGCDKVKQISNLKPRYLTKKTVRKFIEKSDRFRDQQQRPRAQNGKTCHHNKS